MATEFKMIGPHISRALLLACSLSGSMMTGAAFAQAPLPAASAKLGQDFASADEAVAALIAALRGHDKTSLRAVLGPDSDTLISSGDRIADAESRDRFLAAYDAKHALVAGPAGRTVLQVGAQAWPVPLPLVQTAGRWHFDTRLGAQELVDRRIGENEIAAIRTSLAYADAQKLYFTQAGEFAQQLVSTPGQHNGLYWPAEAGGAESPLAPLVAQAKDAGYPGELVAGRQAPYQGYYFRILKTQGNQAPSGAMDYVSGGHMTKGFALVAAPARYGSSGIMTFVINQDGIVFQKDLGPRTAEIASTMPSFNPDLSWIRVDVVDQ